MSHQELPIEDRPIPERIDLHAKKKLPPWAIVAIAAGVVAAAFAALCVYVSTLDTIFPHTVVQLAIQADGTPLDVDVGSMTADQAAELCAAPDWQTAELWRGGELLVSPKLSELGIAIDAKATAQKAATAFRSDNLLLDAVSYVKHLFGSHVVLPVYTVDDAVLAATAEDYRLHLANEVVHGAYELVEGEGLYLTRPKDGPQIDAAALCAAVKETVRTNHDTVFSFECPFVTVTGTPLSVADLHAELSGPVQESRCDKSTGEPTPSRVGVAFDVDAVQAQLDAAAPGERFLADAKVTFPKATEEFLKENMFRDVLGSATTKVTGTWSRINNVKLSAAAINGKIYNPGQEFWYNATVGERTEAKGYGGAPSYVGGKTVGSEGGGDCQTSYEEKLPQLDANL